MPPQPIARAEGLMTAFYRDSPPRLLQEGSKCWSAAASAWTAVTKKVEEITFIDLLDEAKAAKVSAWNGALRGDDGVRWLAKRLNMQWVSGKGLAENASILPRLRKSHDLHVPQEHLEALGARRDALGHG